MIIPCDELIRQVNGAFLQKNDLFLYCLITWKADVTVAKRIMLVDKTFTKAKTTGDTDITDARIFVGESSVS